MARTPNADHVGDSRSRAIAKPVSQYTVVGNSFPRIDIPAKVTGTYTYIQNVRIPGMLHGRSVRPRGAGANTVENHYAAERRRVLDQRTSRAPRSCRINNFIAVVAPKEYDAIQAAAQLKVVWKSDPKLPAAIRQLLVVAPPGRRHEHANPPATPTDSGDVDAALAGAAKTGQRDLQVPLQQLHADRPALPRSPTSTGRSGGTVYCPGQAINGAPGQISPASSARLDRRVNTPAANYRVVWYEGASSFGGGSARARSTSRPRSSRPRSASRCACSGCAGTSTAGTTTAWRNMCDVTMGADANGKIVGADWQTYGQARATSTRRSALLGTDHLAGGSGCRRYRAVRTVVDSAPYANTSYATSYNYPRRVLAKTQPLYGGALKCNFLRAPNAPQQYFASEQIVDELAHAMNMDPVAFRRQNIDPTATLPAPGGWR